MVVGQQDGSVDKGTCYQAWRAEFDNPGVHMVELENQLWKEKTPLTPPHMPFHYINK